MNEEGQNAGMLVCSDFADLRAPNLCWGKWQERGP